MPLDRPIPDLLLAGLVAVVLPAGAWVLHVVDRRWSRSTPESAAVTDSEASLDRLRSYRNTMIFLWVPTILVLARWLTEPRPIADLGLGLPSGRLGFVVTAVVVALSIGLLLQTRIIARRPAVRVAAANQLAAAPHLLAMLPKTKVEWRRFQAVSITAGVTEEILFRGHLLWVLTAWVDPWLAGALALVPFVLAHAWQGAAAPLVRVTGTAIVLTGLAVMTGSLLPGIVLHVAIDLGSGGAAYEVLRRRDSPSRPSTPSTPSPPSPPPAAPDADSAPRTDPPCPPTAND